MDKKEIVEKLSPIIDSPDICGFEAYLVTKSAPKLKKLKLSMSDLQLSLKKDIIAVLLERYMAEDAVYMDAMNVADNQVKYYILQQTDEYKPFDLENWDSEDFMDIHLDEFIGFMFLFRYDQQEIWCYQKKRNVTLTNRKKTNLFARLMHYDNGWVFKEQNETIIHFAHAIDILIIDGNLITSDVELLERSFDFQTFIHQKAKEVANVVAQSNLFSGMDKLNVYLSSDVKSHRPYRKKIMKAFDSPVLQMQPDKLFNKLSTLPRWKGRFRDPIDGMIPLTTNKEIESMIDLLIERFTVSEVTGQEYDTEVKKKAEDINIE